VAVVTLTEREDAEITAANATGRRPVVFVHGLWLLAASWDPWREHFEEKGYATLAPGWPDDPETAAEAREHPEVLAGKSLGEITHHYAEAIGGLARKPVVIGHSFGGLLTEKLAGQGLAAGAVAIDPAPFRGVLPLPLSALRSSSPVLRNPANRNKAVGLTYEQFRYAFANAVPEDEAHQLYEDYSVPGPGKPVFQAASANINPRSEASVEVSNAMRGPLLVISGERDHTVPRAVAHASYTRHQKHSPAPVEFIEIAGRGHSLTIDSGWQEVADTALDFLARHDLGPDA
jgi:pimeloyl-ACP methyl ester carboxylesterase